MIPNNNLNKILIIDFGSQFTQLIARRVRELGVYSEIISHKKLNLKLEKKRIKGIILSGGPLNVYQSKKVRFNKKLFSLNVPILGICFGHQFLAHIFGGTVDTLWQNSKKVGIRKVKVLQNNLLEKSKTDFLIYSHREGVVKCPANFEIAATSNMVNIEGLVHKTLPIWTFQPHIEASKTFSRRIGLSADEFNKCDFFGKQLLKSFFNKLK